MNVSASLNDRKLSDCITRGRPLREINLRRPYIGLVHSDIAPLYIWADKHWTGKVHTGMAEWW
ncbi:hypothetical protein T07_7900 [Trichinella nelsoni]|uniref:Uncharacterized protein n=1 Tax=Trichinella nelsoni TaxID=6336 RepID=A0A0V0RBK3_9BILA|nr:hypothetical protein T07_7900 [Trichinella nelsoni]